MKVGVYGYTQNWWDNQRFTAYEADPTDQTNALPDADNAVFQEDLRFLGLVEDLGFDDLWTVEHHFSPYAETSNPLQYLSFWAGRTSRIGLGTMVIVLPWHDPIRVAEEIIALQHFLGHDRDLTIGFGRGVARREYGGFRIPQGESRERFAEALEIIKRGVGLERFSFEGRYFTVPDVSQRPQSPHLSLRPTPLDRARLLDSFHAAWGSAGSAPRLAAQGLKPLIIPQRATWHYEKELADFYDAGSSAGHDPASPVVAQWVYCSTDRDVMERGRRAMTTTNECLETNYEFSAQYHGDVPGYESWSAIQEGVAEDIAEDAIIGTPEQCIAKLESLNDLLHPRQFNFAFKFGDLTSAEADRSIRLFAEEVMPHVKQFEIKPPKVRATA